MRDPDAFATVSLWPVQTGGREMPTPADWFGCIAMTAGGNFDCRMRLDEPLVPGTTRRVQLYFLSPDLAKAHVAGGAPFTLWDGKTIGAGRVERWYNSVAAE